ncbi:unnamed protein product [Lepidochelys olivacea]
MRSQGPWRLCSYSPWTLWRPSTPSRPAWWKPVSRPSSVEKNQELYGGSLMGDLAVMVTLLPSLPEAVLGQSPAGEFIFLLDRSGSMECPMDGQDRSPQRIDSAKAHGCLAFLALSAVPTPRTAGLHLPAGPRQALGSLQGSI